MSPLAFLAIPLVVFIVGSCALLLKARFATHDLRARRAPDELQAVVPVLEQQRQQGWNVGATNVSHRN